MMFKSTFTPLFFTFAVTILLAECGSKGVGKPAAAAESTPVIAESTPLTAGVIAFDYDRHLYFDVMVRDSIPATLIFDTGATGLYVDSLWLVRSGIKPIHREPAYIGGAGGGHDKTELLRDTLGFRIDSLRLYSHMTVVLQLKEILGRRADGIFGQEYLAGDCIEFNLEEGYMRRVSADTLARAGFIREKIEKKNNRIYLRASVEFDAEHTLEGRFLLDTGCPYSMELSPSAAHKARFDTYSGHKIAYSTLWGGIGGETEGFSCRAGSVEFGGHRFTDVPVNVSATRTTGTGDDYMGIVGNEMFERFDMVIDFASPALWLRPKAGVDSPWPPVLSAGFSLVDRTDICEGWFVSRLYEPPYSPVGLRGGDLVVTWDGKPVTELDADSIRRVPGDHRIEVLRDGVRTEYQFQTKEIL